MLTAGGKEDGSQITVQPTLSVALRSDARVEPIAVPARSAERTASLPIILDISLRAAAIGKTAKSGNEGAVQERFSCETQICGNILLPLNQALPGRLRNG